MRTPLVSVIVPVLNDAEQLESLLSSFQFSNNVELIVVNGGMPDQAMSNLRLRFPSVHWMEGPQGRGQQMNQGSKQAKGQWLLFLHADSRLSPHWIEEIRRAQAEEHCVAGSFRLRLDSTALLARVIEWGVALRVRWLGLPYGDQALFVRHDVFKVLGGYRPWPLMEDVDLVRRLRLRGRLMRSNLSLSVSARRWERNGWLQCSLENMFLVMLFMVGVTPERLASFYYRGTSHKSLR